MPLGGKPCSHRTSRNRYLDIRWTKEKQISQVTYSRFGMDITLRCPHVPAVSWIKMWSGGKKMWSRETFRCLSSRCLIGNCQLGGDLHLPTSGYFFPEHYWIWFNSALHSSLEYFPALVMTSVLVAVILAAYSFAVSDFAASIKYNFPLPPFSSP